MVMTQKLLRTECNFVKEIE